MCVTAVGVFCVVESRLDIENFFSIYIHTYVNIVCIYVFTSGRVPLAIFNILVFKFLFLYFVCARMCLILASLIYFALSLDIVSLICNATGIPHLQFDMGFEETNIERVNHQMSLNVFPTQQMLSKAYADIVLTYGWRKFTIIYDGDDRK